MKRYFYQALYTSYVYVYIYNNSPLFGTPRSLDEWFQNTGGGVI